ncbi:hypothetical protein JRQ81_000891 [Phrynocephalus forsythii]|uniref:Methyltransferase type 11 domain-containing protein n=1 Tax=Phrynocephalus forsythii TaxID=171643 RepID=A0A9Q1B8F4_9SAUR|nr:hypothetical protein JRQ81_000891 [Phrynocephalus forsythii]
MDFSSARHAILNVVKGMRAGDVPQLLHWMKTTSDFDEFTSNNKDIILRSIAEDLRHSLPTTAMISSEHLALQKLHEQTKPTLHVDAFLYDDDCFDSLCEKGEMSRNYCLTCGSHRTAPLEFISHSFSLTEVKFLYEHVLPDLTGKVVVDVGSRLGAVLFGGYFYSSASEIYGVEMNTEFCQLQETVVEKYQLFDRIKVLNADICTQAPLLKNADVVIMNNVFEYFLDRSEQARCWKFINENVRKKGSLLVTVPSLEKSLSELQVDIPLNQWVEAIPLHYDVFLEGNDREALEEICLYRIL